jgi:hypothetical protein
MSSIKTVAGFVIVAAALVTGFKSQRALEVEADNAVRPMIEQSVRMNAVDFNPKVALTQPELKDFSLVGVKITRSRIGAMINSAFGGGDRSYEVYVRFREGGDEKCLTLALEWRSTTEAWNVSHSGVVDRCEPVW